MAQRAFLSGAQDHAGRLARLECFLPTRSTEAPTVAGFQAAKTEFRHRCRKIVAAGFGKLEKRGGHDGADRVATDEIGRASCRERVCGSGAEVELARARLAGDRQ